MLKMDTKQECQDSAQKDWCFKIRHLQPLEAQNLLAFKLRRTGDLKQLFPASINPCLGYFAIKSELVFYADDKWNAKGRANHKLWARFAIFSHWSNYHVWILGEAVINEYLLAVAIIVFLLLNFVNKRWCSLPSSLSCLVNKGNLFLLFLCLCTHYLDSGGTTWKIKSALIKC